MQFAVFFAPPSCVISYDIEVLFLASLGFGGELSWSLAISVANDGVVFVVLVHDTLSNFTSDGFGWFVWESTEVLLTTECGQVSILEMSFLLDWAVDADDTFKIITEHWRHFVLRNTRDDEWVYIEMMTLNYFPRLFHLSHLSFGAFIKFFTFSRKHFTTEQVRHMRENE